MSGAWMTFDTNGHVIDDNAWLKYEHEACVACGLPAWHWGSPPDRLHGECWAEEEYRNLWAKSGFWVNPGL